MMPRGNRGESNGFKKPKRSKAERDAEALEAAREGQEESEQSEPGPGHNGPGELTEDQRISLTFTHRRAYITALEAKKKAAREFLQVCKLAKADLGDDAVPDIRDMIALETEEGERKLKADVDRRIKVSRWMGLPVGSEPSLFPDVDRTPAVDKAFAEGKRHGLAGDRQQPPAPGTPVYDAYLKGFHEGNAVLGSGIRAPTPIEAAVQHNTTDDEDTELDALEPSEHPPEPAELAHS